jgi:hypothetical protein
MMHLAIFSFPKVYNVSRLEKPTSRSESKLVCVTFEKSSFSCGCRVRRKYLARRVYEKNHWVTTDSDVFGGVRVEGTAASIIPTPGSAGQPLATTGGYGRRRK